MIPNSLKKPPTVSVRPDEVKRLDDFLREVPSSPGPDGTIQITFSKRQLDLIRTVCSTFLWMLQLLSFKKFGIAIIRKVLNIHLSSSPKSDQQEGGPNQPDHECPHEKDNPNGNDQNSGQDFGQNPSPLPPLPEGSVPAKGRSNPNHPGKRTSEDLKDAEVSDHFHCDLTEGASCPRTGCRGRVYLFLRDGKIREVLTFNFSAPFRPTVHRMRDLRCNSCFRVYKATFPDELVKNGAPKERYLYPAQAALVLLHFGMGLPFYRLDQFQFLTGERFPESTQFDILEKVANVFRNFILAATKAAADGFLFQGDDVGNRVLELVPELRERRSDGQLTYREGIHTSLLISMTMEGNLIPILKTGINHFGELLDLIFALRSPGLSAPNLVCDGSKVNQTFVAQPIMGGCLQHARDYFIKAGKNFPEEAGVLIVLIKDIFKIDRQTHDMGAQDRLNHLQEFAKPILEKIKVMVDDHLKSRLVLPKSEFGQAIGYFHSQYERLLIPFTHPGVPIHNNLSEWCTYPMVRYLMNSKFYMSKAGAAIGDTLMMVLLISYLANRNPYQFILHGLRHQSEIKKNPEAFFPWNLRGEVEALPPHKQMRFWAPAPPSNLSG